MITMISIVILEGAKEILSTIKLYKLRHSSMRKVGGHCSGMWQGLCILLASLLLSPLLSFSPRDSITLFSVAWGVDILLIHYKVTCNDDLLFRKGYFLAAASSSQVCSAPGCFSVWSSPTAVPQSTAPCLLVYMTAAMRMTE